MSRILQALKQLETRPGEAAPDAVAPPVPAPAAPDVSSPVAADAAVTHDLPVAPTVATPPIEPPIARNVTERIAPRRREPRRAEDAVAAAEDALETAAEVARLLATVAPGVIECWTSHTADSESFAAPAPDPITQAALPPQVIVQECLPKIIEVPVPRVAEPVPASSIPGSNDFAPTLDPAQTEIELDFRPAKPRRVKQKSTKANRKAAALDVRESQVRSAVRGSRVSGVSRPCAWETTIRADLENASLVAPFDQLLARLIQDRGTTVTTSLLIASLGGPLAAAEVAMRTGVLLTQRDDVSVLVIDADPEAALSRRLAITGKPGLSELLAPQDAHGETIYPSASARLHILPRGRTPWPADADGACVERLLTELSHDYAWILVAAGEASSPPTQALARACRGTYAVAPLGDTDLIAAQGQLAALHAAGARVLGAIALGGH